MTTSSTPGAEQLLERIWKLIAARGIVAIAFGVVLIVWPDIGLSAMTALVGAFALVTGAMAGAAAIALRTEPGRERLWLALDAIAGLAIGVAVLVWPDLSATALLYVIAAWVIVTGAIQLAAAVLLPLDALRSLLLGLGGVVLGALGVVMFVEPGKGAIALLALIAATAIVNGIFDLALARELRRVPEELKQWRTGQLRTHSVAHG
jgi:uncharacterized membrane protein HdeD (DUF308 family)